MLFRVPALPHLVLVQLGIDLHQALRELVLLFLPHVAVPELLGREFVGLGWRYPQLRTWVCAHSLGRVLRLHKVGKSGSGALVQLSCRDFGRGRRHLVHEEAAIVLPEFAPIRQESGSSIHRHVSRVKPGLAPLDRHCFF